MRNLLLIFVATTGYLRAIGVLVIIMIIISGLFLQQWSSYDTSEVHLRNRIIAQQQIVDLIRETNNKDLLLIEQQKLVDYKSEYDNLREVWLGEMFLSRRPIVDISLGSKPCASLSKDSPTKK